MEQKPAFWRALTPGGRRQAGAALYMYFVLGMAVIMIGSLLPSIQAEYALSYRVSGWMLSVMSIGQLTGGLLCGVMTVSLGIKRSILALCNLLLIGFFVITRTASPALLMAAMLLVGLKSAMGALLFFAASGLILAIINWRKGAQKPDFASRGGTEEE